MPKEKTKSESKTIESLAGIGERTAEKLRDAGYNDIMAIAASSIQELSCAAEIGENTAAKIINSARDALQLGFETGLEVMERRKSIERIKTGSTTLDNLFGGGIQTQAITEAYGPFGSGKSQLGFQLATMVALKNYEIAYIDTENTFRPERIKQICECRGVDPKKVLEKIHYARAFNSDHQIILTNKIEELISKQKRKLRLVIVDSLTSHFRAEYSGRGSLANRQQKLNRHIHALQKIADIYNVAVYVTNQVMSKPDVFFGPGLEAIGGNIVAHSSTYRVFLRKSKNGKRIARMVDSPDLPEGEAVFRISEKGITD
jgi:DNA repair protein RadA